MKTSMGILWVSLCAITFGAAEMRVFTNKEGKPLEAEIVSKTDSHVKLRTPATKGGKVYTVAIATLSEKDQEFVKAWVDGAARAKELADIDLEDVMKAKGYTKVGFDEEMNHLFIDVKIDGKKGRFLLDTGAMATIMKESSAAKFDLEIKPANVQAGGVGGGAQIKGQVNAKEFEMGGAKGGEQTFYIMDLNHMPQNYASKMDGIIGGDFFKAKKAHFDYAGGVLWVKLD
ncbi:MAG: clan AA aspartic protease [Akkermansiaceae bacterium]|nr:clan AA aspartic protease [Akkermansiaceae bacterium]